MDHRYEIVVNPEYRTIKIVSDDPQIQNVIRVGSNLFIDALPEHINALKQVSEAHPYVYHDADSSMHADSELVRAWLFREDYEYYYEIDRLLYIEVLSAYAIKCYQHKDILYPYMHQGSIRSLDEVLPLLK